MIVKICLLSTKLSISSHFIVAVFLVACGGNEKKAGKRAVKVGIETVSDGASCVDNEYVGTVESSSETVLSFELGGNITRILVNEGDKVVKGQRLADVSPTSLKNSYEASVATLAQAKDAWRRMKKLHEEGVVSEIKWVEIDTKLKQAESAERISREQLSHTSIVAPFSGVITGRIGEVGMNVLPGQPVLNQRKRTIGIRPPNIKIKTNSSHTYFCVMTPPHFCCLRRPRMNR